MGNVYYLVDDGELDLWGYWTLLGLGVCSVKEIYCFLVIVKCLLCVLFHQTQITNRNITLNNIHRVNVNRRKPLFRISQLILQRKHDLWRLLYQSHFQPYQIHHSQPILKQPFIFSTVMNSHKLLIILLCQLITSQIKCLSLLYSVH